MSAQYVLIATILGFVATTVSAQKYIAAPHAKNGVLQVNHEYTLAPVMTPDGAANGLPDTLADEATVIWGPSELPHDVGGWTESSGTNEGCTSSIAAEPDCGLMSTQGEPTCGFAAPEPTCGLPTMNACEPTCGLPSSGCTGPHATPTCGCRGCNRQPSCGLCWELGDAFSLWDTMLGDCAECCPWDIGGWVSTGYHDRSTGLFNSHPNRLNVHQGWLYLERTPDTETKQIDWGFRADVVYGVDAADTQAFGNNPGRWDFQNGFDRGAGFGWALPQVYGTLATENVSLQVGHFFTLIGYETVTAPNNFFYSHAYTMYNSEPFTHTGALATINATEDVTVYGGWTLGWDTGFDQFGDGNSFLGGLGLALTEDVALTYMTTFGDLGWRGDGYSHSVVLDATLTEKLNYVFQSDLVRVENVGTGKNDDIGINQYLFYDVCDTMALGARAEWWKTDGTSFYEVTTGVNFRPFANFVIRPEMRYDWSPSTDLSAATFGIDMVTTF